MCKTDKYRWDGSTGTLYEYNKAHKAYLYCAKGRTKREAIRHAKEMIQDQIDSY